MRGTQILIIVGLFSTFNAWSDICSGGGRVEINTSSNSEPREITEDSLLALIAAEATESATSKCEGEINAQLEHVMERMKLECEQTVWLPIPVFPGGTGFVPVSCKFEVTEYGAFCPASWINRPDLEDGYVIATAQGRGTASGTCKPDGFGYPADETESEDPLDWFEPEDPENYY